MSRSPTPPSVEHVEPGADEGEPAENPLVNELDFQVQVPNVLKVTMVDASTLKAYEEWAVAAALLLNLAVGFTVGAATAEPHVLLAIVAGIFWGLFFAATLKTQAKRRPVTEATKQVSYRLARRKNVRVAAAPSSLSEGPSETTAEGDAEEEDGGSGHEGTKRRT